MGSNSEIAALNARLDVIIPYSSGKDWGASVAENDANVALEVIIPCSSGKDWGGEYDF